MAVKHFSSESQPLYFKVICHYRNIMSVSHICPFPLDLLSDYGAADPSLKAFFAYIYLDCLLPVLVDGRVHKTGQNQRYQFPLRKQLQPLKNILINILLEKALIPLRITSRKIIDIHSTQAALFKKNKKKPLS